MNDFVRKTITHHKLDSIDEDIKKNEKKSNEEINDQKIKNLKR